MLPIKVFRSDNGGEFVNSTLSHFFHTKDVLPETTCPQTPQQNGVTECKNGQILAATHGLLLGASVPKRFWMDVVTYVVYLLNHLSSRVLDFQTPMQDEMFFSDTPEHVLQGETSSEGYNWLDLQGGGVLDNLIQREEPTEPVEPVEPDTLIEPATLAKPATPVEPAILTDVAAISLLS
ncbi:hypothetical protein L3X38_037175 [Prunus dulcis]|uniref:Integrase catalytic domain-containing protein n=1 Tax=Prunus dulcis TaxID=3755 RepID=A0AAD4YR16_PRUDU|nr:hypothetical protein L3X38_037175 [Prunus dulcis]